MYLKGHVGINAIIYSPVAFLTQQHLSTGLALIGGLFCIGITSLPDEDRHFQEGMSNKSKLLTLIPIKHRGRSHTVWFAILIGAIFSIGTYWFLSGGFAPDSPIYTILPEKNHLEISLFIGFNTMLGIIAHIVGDVLTPTGVKPFAPIRKNKYTLNICKAKNSRANKAFLIVGGISIFMSVFIL